jgi:hypothetical protein
MDIIVTLQSVIVDFSLQSHRYIFFVDENCTQVVMLRKKLKLLRLEMNNLCARNQLQAVKHKG